MADNKTVKITFEIDGLEQSVSSIDDAKDALKKLEDQAKKAEKSVEKTGKEIKDMGNSAKESGEAGEGAIKVLDEATGGLATKFKEVGGGLKAMGKSAVTAFKASVQGANSFKKALIATGIGAIVVAVGLLVAYWDDIKGFVSGVSSEQKKLLKATQDTAAAAEDALSATEASENSLKLAGKSEKEIRNIKIQQTDEIIAATGLILEQQKQQKKAQVEAAERNQKITAGIIGFLTAPITLLLGAVDALTYGLEKIGVLKEATSLAEDFVMGTASLLFDPEEVAAEGDATIAETEKQLRALKNKRDGYLLADKKEREDAAAKAKEEADTAAQEAADAEAQRLQELADLKKSIRDAEANTEAELRAKALEDLDLYYAELITKAQANGIATDELEASRLEAMNALKQKYADEDAARSDAEKAKAKEVSDYEKQLAKQVADTKLGVATAAFDSISQIAGEQSAVGKAAAVASATINTYQAATNALANTPAPPPFPQIAAGVAIASGLLNVKKILSTPTPAGGGGGGSAGSAPSVPTAPVYDPNAALQAAQQGQDQQNVVGLDQSQGQTTGMSIKAYVVSDDMTTQQEADKKINDLARL